MKHTKGNWKIDIEVDGNLWIGSDNKTSMIANVCSGFNGATKLYEPEDDELANAKLIAAAPELLKELNNMIKVYGWTDMLEGEEQDAIGTAKEAIKKATE